MFDVVREDLLKIALCDLLLYRTEKETGLFLKQEETWGNVLLLLKKRCGFSLRVTRGIMPILQKKEEKNKIAEIINALPDEKVENFYAASRILGSTLLVMAVYFKLITAEYAFDCAIIDEIWQNNISGYDKEEVSRRESLRKEFYTVVKRVQDE